MKCSLFLNITGNTNRLISHVPDLTKQLSYEQWPTRPVVAIPFIIHEQTIVVVRWTLVTKDPPPNMIHHSSSEPSIKRRCVTITQLVVEWFTDTATPQPNDTDTDTDSSDDCLSSGILQKKNSAGERITKYFIFWSHSLTSQTWGKYYELMYNDGDTERMTNTKVLKSLSLCERYHK